MDLTVFCDHIYEAAIVPELWPSVLQRFSEATGSIGAGVALSRGADFHWTASPSIADFSTEYFRSGWAQRDVRLARAMERQLRGFVADHDLLTPEERDADPTYAYLKDHGYGPAAVMVAPIPNGDRVVVAVNRLLAEGAFEAPVLEGLNCIAADLARAGLVSARLGLEKARAAAETMRAIGLPAAVLSGSHRLLLANDLFHQLVPSLMQDRAERLAISDPAADVLLARALAESSFRRGCAAQLQSLPIAAGPGRPAMVLHVVPIRRSAHDIFFAGEVILVVTAVDRSVRPQTSLLQGLFDLTPTEARIAKAIACGRQISSIAHDHGVSSETVRSQLKSVFAKTGTSRQADLVRLLLGASLSGF